MSTRLSCCLARPGNLKIEQKSEKVKVELVAAQLAAGNVKTPETTATTLIQQGVDDLSDLESLSPDALTELLVKFCKLNGLVTGQIKTLVEKMRVQAKVRRSFDALQPAIDQVSAEVEAFLAAKGMFAYAVQCFLSKSKGLLEAVASLKANVLELEREAAAWAYPAQLRMLNGVATAQLEQSAKLGSLTAELRRQAIFTGCEGEEAMRAVADDPEAIMAVAAAGGLSQAELGEALAGLEARFGSKLDHVADTVAGYGDQLLRGQHGLQARTAAVKGDNSAVLEKFDAKFEALNQRQDRKDAADAQLREQMAQLIALLAVKGAAASAYQDGLKAEMEAEVEARQGAEAKAASATVSGLVAKLQASKRDVRALAAASARAEQLDAAGAARELGCEGVSAELKDSAEALLAQALAAQTARDLAEAHRLFAAARDRDPTSTAAWLGMGYCLAEAALGKYHNERLADKAAARDQGILSCRKVLELDPKRFSAHVNLAILLKSKGELDEAERLYRRALELGPFDVGAHVNLAILHEGKGELGEAESLYRRALELVPKDVSAHVNLSNLLKSKGEFGEAERLYRRTLELDPKHVGAHVNLANLLQVKGELGDLDEAEHLYRRALELDPKHVVAHYNLATLVQGKGELGEAERLYRRALELSPGFAYAHGGLGDTLRLEGKMGEAEAACREALKLKPGDAWIKGRLEAALKAKK